MAHSFALIFIIPTIPLYTLHERGTFMNIIFTLFMDFSGLQKDLNNSLWEIIVLLFTARILKYINHKKEF